MQPLDLRQQREEMVSLVEILHARVCNRSIQLRQRERPHRKTFIAWFQLPLPSILSKRFFGGIDIRLPEYENDVAVAVSTIVDASVGCINVDCRTLQYCMFVDWCDFFRPRRLQQHHRYTNTIFKSLTTLERELRAALVRSILPQTIVSTWVVRDHSPSDTECSCFVSIWQCCCWLIF